MVQSVLLCGLVLVVLYALIVIATGIFIVYTQFFAPDLISNLNAAQGKYFRVREKRMDERLLKDPVARLLQADELKLDGGLQTFAPYEAYDDQPSDEEKQIHEAAAAIDQFERSRLPLEFGLNRWFRSRKLLSVSNKLKTEAKTEIVKRTKRSTCNETPKRKFSIFFTINFVFRQIA